MEPEAGAFWVCCGRQPLVEEVRQELLASPAKSPEVLLPAKDPAFLHRKAGPSAEHGATGPLCLPRTLSPFTHLNHGVPMELPVIALHPLAVQVGT